MYVNCTCEIFVIINLIAQGEKMEECDCYSYIIFVKMRKDGKLKEKFGNGIMTNELIIVWIHD